jgi:hypothetical protein
MTLNCGRISSEADVNRSFEGWLKTEAPRAHYNCAKTRPIWIIHQLQIWKCSPKRPKRVSSVIISMGAQAINTAPMATAVHHLIEAQWMAHLSRGGLRPVFDLSQQRRLDPSSMCDLLAIGLGLADQMGTRELKTRHSPSVPRLTRQRC